MAINIIKKYGTANTTVKKNRKVEYIAIHYTASVSSKKGVAQAIASMFANPKTQASADFIVDDAEIVQYNGDILNRYCWAVGGSKYNTKGGSLFGKAMNNNCISIEVSSYNTTGKMKNANAKSWAFTDDVLKNATELTKHLMNKYNIDESHVIRHYDVNGKLCPGIVGWNKDSGSEKKWKDFKSTLTTKKTETKKTSNKPKTTVTPQSSAEDIKWLQTKLNECLDDKYKNLLSNKKLTVDGKFGAQTSVAISYYWKQLDWDKSAPGSDGFYHAGEKTLDALDNGKKK